MSAAMERDPSGKSPHEPGAKLDEGKVKAGVLDDFALALMAVAEVGTFGANKYTRGGWQSVPNGKQRYRDALWRHHLKERHEPKDPETGLLHKAHKAWNALAELELELRGEQLYKNVAPGGDLLQETFAPLDQLPPAPIAESEESTGAGATLEQSPRWPVRMGVNPGYVHHCKCTETTGRMFNDPREFSKCPSCGKETQGKWNG